MATKIIQFYNVLDNKGATSPEGNCYTKSTLGRQYLHYHNSLHLIKQETLRSLYRSGNIARISFLGKIPEGVLESVLVGLPHLGLGNLLSLMPKCSNLLCHLRLQSYI